MQDGSFSEASKPLGEAGLLGGEVAPLLDDRLLHLAGVGPGPEQVETVVRLPLEILFGFYGNILGS